MNNLPETKNVPRGIHATVFKGTTTVIISPRDPPSFVPFPATLRVTRTALTRVTNVGVCTTTSCLGRQLKKIFAKLHNAMLGTTHCLNDGPQPFQKAGRPIWTNIHFFPQKAGIMLYLRTTPLNTKEGFLLDSWPPKKGPIGCPETSVRNYHYSLRNTPEQGSSYLLCGGSLKSRTLYFYRKSILSSCNANRDFTVDPRKDSQAYGRKRQKCEKR